jgi:hypothetical protein
MNAVKDRNICLKLNLILLGLILLVSTVGVIQRNVGESPPFSKIWKRMWTSFTFYSLSKYEGL